MHRPPLPARIRELLDAEQYDEVARITQDRAKSGDREAQFIMGYLYFHLYETGDHGVEIDLDQAQRLRLLVKSLEE